MQESYEERISQLQGLAIPNNVRSSNTGTEVATEDVQYDVFVSHAWEDKESFADEFVKELNKLNLRVWYDTSQIKWGDSMRAKIDEGLKKSKFGVVVLSPDYIKEGKYWTKAELDGLFQLEERQWKNTASCLAQPDQEGSYGIQSNYCQQAGNDDSIYDTLRNCGGAGKVVSD